MVCMKIDDGRAMPVSSKNFEAGMILPRATPARSGTRHSISVMPRWAAQALASARLVTGWRSAERAAFFLDMGAFGHCEGEHAARGGGAIGCVFDPANRPV